MGQGKQAKTGNNNAIDLAKFICAGLIILLHVPPFMDGDPGSVYSRINYYVHNYATRTAVPFFFICSGYFLYRKTTPEGFEAKYSKKYVLRILRLYVTWSAIYLPIVIHDYIVTGTGVLRAAALYARNFLFVGSYIHLWYMNALITAVCIVSLLLYRGVKPRRILAAAACMYFIGLFDHSLFGFLPPLRESLPWLWKGLKFAERVMGTTRNGLFFGFPFVAAGMAFAYYETRIRPVKAAALFAVSMALMLGELVLSKRYGFLRERDMYVFLVPAACFLFLAVKQVRLPESRIWKVLREMSSLMYYTHLWVFWIVCRALEAAGVHTRNSCVHFLLVFGSTLAVSGLIRFLAGREKLKGLRKLYS